MQAQNNARMEKGRAIAQLHAVTRIDQNSYRVKSQSGNDEYQVMSSELGWLCSCPDAMFRNEKCKHAFAVEFRQIVREAVEVRKIQPIIIADC